MTTQQPGAPSYGQPGHDPTQLEQYDNSQPEYEDPSGQQPGAAAGGRKKRHYAGQAYDFGQGANSTLSGHPAPGVPNPGPYPLPPGASNASYGQQPQQGGYQQAGYGNDQASPQIVGDGQQQFAGVGGYLPPGPGYPFHEPPAAQQPGVGGITQGMSNMGIGGQPQYHPQQVEQRVRLNQLYPTDLLSQPFNVAELEIAPPPIILPPNVRRPRKVWYKLY